MPNTTSNTDGIKTHIKNTLINRLIGFNELSDDNKDTIVEIVTLCIEELNKQASQTPLEIVENIQELKDSEGKGTKNGGPTKSDLEIMQNKKCSDIKNISMINSKLIITFNNYEKTLELSGRSVTNGELRGITVKKILENTYNKEHTILEALADYQTKYNSFIKYAIGAIKEIYLGDASEIRGIDLGDASANQEITVPDAEQINNIINSLSSSTEKAEETEEKTIWQKISDLLHTVFIKPFIMLGNLLKSAWNYMFNSKAEVPETEQPVPATIHTTTSNGLNTLTEISRLKSFESSQGSTSTNSTANFPSIPSFYSIRSDENDGNYDSDNSATYSP